MNISAWSLLPTARLITATAQLTTAYCNINIQAKLFTPYNRPLRHSYICPVKKLGRFGKIIRNKYLLVVLALGVWLLFFDKNDFFTQWKNRAEVKKLEADVEYYKSEIERNRTEMKELQSNPELLEKFAREHYLMHRDNEDIFILVTDTVANPEFSDK